MIIIIIIIIIITIIIILFKSQFTPAEHECSINWGDCEPNKSNQINRSNKSVFSKVIQVWYQGEKSSFEGLNFEEITPFRIRYGICLHT